MNKKTYIAKVYDPIINEHLPVAVATGTNKEIVMRCAAGMARNRKTKEHWKKKISISAKLYNCEELEKDENALPLLVRRF